MPITDKDILAGIKKGAHPQGVLLSFPGPEGEDIQVVVKKATGSDFIGGLNFIREEYNAREEGARAQKARAERASKAASREAVDSPTDNGGSSSSVQQDISEDKEGIHTPEEPDFRESLLQRQAELVRRIRAGRVAEREHKAVVKALEVLNESHDEDAVRGESGGSPEAERGATGEGENTDRPNRKGGGSRRKAKRGGTKVTQD